MLEVKNLSCTRGNRSVLHDVNFTVNQGDILHVKAINGKGKTTLFRAILGMLTYSGEVINHLRSQPMWLSSGFPVKEHLTIEDNINFLLAMKDMQVSQDQILQALHKVNLLSEFKTSCAKLSSGQKRRLLLSLLFLPQVPTIIILDEPWEMLDTLFSRTLEERLIQLATSGKLIIFSSHQNYCVEYKNYLVINL